MSDPGILQPEGWALYFLVVIQWIQPLVDHQKVECRIPGRKFLPSRLPTHRILYFPGARALTSGDRKVVDS